MIALAVVLLAWAAAVWGVSRFRYQPVWPPAPVGPVVIPYRVGSHVLTDAEVVESFLQVDLMLVRRQAEREWV